MTGSPSDAQLEMVRAVLGRDVRRLAHPGAVKNDHFEAPSSGDHDRLFVKVIKDRRRYFDAELAADRFLAGHGLPRIPIRQSGSLSDGAFWIAYDWAPLTPFEPTESSLARLADLLGAIHDLGAGWQEPTLRTFASPPELAWSAITRVRAIDSALAVRLGRLVDEAMRRWQPAVADALCFLHGDFGFRNVGYTPGPQIVLFDYEHASLGAPILEFAKIWDRELSAPSLRRAFLERYRTRAGVSVEGWEDAGFLVRLWGAAGIFPYALQHHDEAFAAHGYRVIARLEQEMGVG